uniref:Serpentine Receptor, class Z n=1 Tax=Caenorhabditis tropicalis TaxID=1561998 RepID=A0A1I7U4K3_9PELO
MVTFVFMIIFFLSLLALYIIIQVFYLLLGLLAVQRLLNYFVPSIEKSFSNVISTVHKYIWYIYIAFCLKEVIGMISAIVCSDEYCKKQEGFILFYISTFFILNLFVMMSAFFYIPITLSVWKLTNLGISYQSKPHRYIFFQTVLLLIFKFTFIPLIIFHKKASLALAIIIIVLTDILVVPLLIQVSYLGCNKRNINILFRNFKLTTFIKVLLDIESEVRPQLNTTRVSRYSNSNV